MAQPNVDSSTPASTATRIGLVVADQRTGDLRQVIYADSRIVLLRDETGNTTLTARDAFDANLGTRYQVRREADPSIDAGQYERLRRRLAEYESQPGRKAAHKADALLEALDLLADPTESEPGVETGLDTDADSDTVEKGNGSPAAEPDSGGTDPEVPFEDVPGIGPETARNLRRHGFVTAGDVRTASDEELRSVSGIGPGNLGKIRDFIE